MQYHVAISKKELQSAYTLHIAEMRCLRGQPKYAGCCFQRSYSAFVDLDLITMLLGLMTSSSSVIGPTNVHGTSHGIVLGCSITFVQRLSDTLSLAHERSGCLPRGCASMLTCSVTAQCGKSFAKATLHMHGCSIMSIPVGFTHGYN